MYAKRSGQAADALTGLAPMLRVTPELQDLCWFSRSWRSEHQPERRGWAPFHIVTEGSCRIELDGSEPVALGSGDVLVLPHGRAHVVRSGFAGTDARAIRSSHHGGVRLRTNTDDVPETEVICGRLRFEQDAASLVLSILPPVVLLRTQGEQSDRMRAIVLAIRDELREARAGATAIASDLASALLLTVLRAHLEREPVGSGLLNLLGEPTTARVLAALVDEPARPWTLDALALHARVSRATLVRDFRRAGGTTPLAFLAELRLGLARQRLATGIAPIGRIAADVGYESESAFSRAFQRRFGQRPGALRRSPAN